MEDKRSFKIVCVKNSSSKNIKYEDGRYLSYHPISAAQKVFGHVHRYHDKPKRFSVIIKIQETTQGSHKKTYKYKVKLEKHKNPLKIKKKGVEVVYKYFAKIKSMN